MNRLLHLPPFPMRVLPLLLLAACTVSDPSILDPLRGDGSVTPEEDATTPTEDMPAPTGIGADLCNAPDDPGSVAIGATTLNMLIDTRTASNSVALQCGSTTTNGKDRFLPLQVSAAGDIWHFHLSVVEGDANVDPVLYLVQEDTSPGACNLRNCFQVSDNCIGDGEEHFAFIAPAGGTWWVGLDSVERDTGALYRLSAYRPVCHDEERSHAESCDDADDSLCSGAPCEDCHCVVKEGFETESAANDTIHEANLIEMPTPDPDSNLRIQGQLGSFSGQCAFPDYYLLEVPDQAGLQMRLIRGGIPCSAENPIPLTMQLQSKDGLTSRATQAEPGTGCSIVDNDNIDGGVYLLKVTHSDRNDRSVIDYQIDITITP